MALWGNRDTFSITGTVDVENASATVAGTSTVFTTELQIGDAVVIAGVKYKVANIASNTSLTLASAYAGSTDTGLTITGQDVPKFLSQAEGRDTFGVNAAETSAGGDNVTNIAVSDGGSRYLEAPTVTITAAAGSSAAASATISGGSVSSIAVTNVGSGYTGAVTVTVAKPRRTIPTSDVGTVNDVITYEDHGLVAGEAVKYFHGGGTALGGLTNDTVYYVDPADADSILLYDTEENALAADGTTGLIDLTGTGNNDQYLEIQNADDQATATASKGSGATGTQVTNPGWVKRTVGTGGRAGRVQYETLVAGRTISGDASDDIQFPDS